MRTLDDILHESASQHTRLCPRQVLGARMSLLAGRELGLDLPRSDKGLLVIVETDGCIADAISAATGCSVGRRTLRIEDYGKVAATFVNVETGCCLRLVPRAEARTTAWNYAPQAASSWEAQLIGYQCMPDAELLAWRWVLLAKPLEAILGRPGVRVQCKGCGEEVINQREVVRGGNVLCLGCAGSAYYRMGESSSLSGRSS
jgi:formylmethanofuran dehydrogenase subunit E